MIDVKANSIGQLGESVRGCDTEAFNLRCSEPEIILKRWCLELGGFCPHCLL